MDFVVEKAQGSITSIERFAGRVVWQSRQSLSIVQWLWSDCYGVVGMGGG